MLSINGICLHDICLRLLPFTFQHTRTIVLSSINNYGRPIKGGFGQNKKIYYDEPKRPLRPKESRSLRYTALEEVKMEKDQHSLIEPMIDRTKPPHKFHVVHKIDSLFGEPWWVRAAMQELGFIIDNKKQWDIRTVIVKNVPSVNKHLWLCKHMVQIKPLTFVDGYPSEKDIGFTKLYTHNGELRILNHVPGDKNVSDTIEPKWPIEFGHIGARLHRDHSASRLHK
ncbi:unnamed protein product, partial [Didymodactylos carnosus]